MSLKDFLDRMTGFIIAAGLRCGGVEKEMLLGRCRRRAGAVPLRSALR